MKKLMIAAAIVCAAAFSQAASISWQADTGYNFVDANGNVHTAATAPAGQFVLVYLGNGVGASWDNAKIVNVGSLDFGTSKSGDPTAKVTGSYKWTYGAEGTPNNGDVFGVMFLDDNGLSKLQTVGGAELAETITISGMGGNNYSGDLYFAKSDYTVASVPEPTSGLLLLLGVAGMALRRRRA